MVLAVAAKAMMKKHNTLLTVSALVVIAGCAQQPNATLTLPEDRSAVETTSSGMLMYMADAAVFRECTTGELFPVRMEVGWRDTESAYLALADEPPGWVLTSGETRFEWGEPMEGLERWHVVFPSTPSLMRGTTCGQPLDQLLDHTWRTVYLDGLPRDRFQDGHRPTVKLRDDSDDESNTDAEWSLAVSGNTGCNQYGGKAVLEQDQLAVSDIIATRMYCMNTADIEQRFLEIIEEVAFGSLEGDRWVWYDASGRWLAEFQVDP